MSNKRADLGFGDELSSFDPAEWETTKETKPKKKNRAVSKAAADASGFSSREPVTKTKPKKVRRRRITGRNQQFNIKTTAETIDAFYAIADSQNWGLGETLEKAVELLEKKYKR